MTITEYQDQVLDVSINADHLAAVVRLLNEHYFEQAFDAGDLAAENWWIANHDNIQDVVGMVTTVAATVKERLKNLIQVHVEGQS